MTGRAVAAGRVASFDAEIGLGTIESDDGATVAFHCTAISDGSRRIEPGQNVMFTIGAGGPGRWEARTVTPIGG